MKSPLDALLEREADSGRRIAIIEQELCPPEPQLLDTCVLQNLDWVDRRIESTDSVIWDEEAVADLTTRYGTELAVDLIDLGLLYKQFETRSGYPWLVSAAAHEELSLADGIKGARIASLLRFFRGHQDDWYGTTYAGVARALLFPSPRMRVSPLLLRGLGVSSVDEIHSATGPLSFLPDDGARLLCADALIANVPVVLTTDRATFWKHRVELNALGLTVLRPSELLKLYEPFWQALDEEFMRRRNAQG